MFTREKKTFISSSLCGRAEWRCLITARRQETGLCFAMKNTADDISLVVQRTIHNKIQIIADFEKTSSTSCQIVQDATYLRWHLFWSASYLHKLQKDEVCLSVSYVLSSLSRGVPSELIAGDVKQIVEKTHKCTRHPNCIKTIDCRPRPSDDVDDDDD